MNWALELLQSLTRSDWISIVGILISSIIAALLYILGKKIDDKQRIEHSLFIQDAISSVLLEGPRDVELYNIKLYDKKHFEKNDRSMVWGYAYHGAGLYNYSFSHVEFVTEIVKWGKNKFYRVGLIPYKRILKIMPEGDSSTSKPVLFVTPRLLQLDKYSISYEKFIYYPLKGGPRVHPPLTYRTVKLAKNLFFTTRYQLYLKWKMKYDRR